MMGERMGRKDSPLSLEECPIGKEPQTHLPWFWSERFYPGKGQEGFEESEGMRPPNWCDHGGTGFTDGERGSKVR